MYQAKRSVGLAGGVEGKPKADSLVSLQAKISKDAYINVNDDVEQEAIAAEISVDQALQEEFSKLASLCRHSKFSEVEDLLNQPDWRLPIDYQDGNGNTILHLVVQNGNKRLAKLCLRRGAGINIQNIYGQTSLHFAYGFGYNLLGDYLVTKGADENIQNKDGLTCYEGMAARDLELL
jgi:ankyrin repeat protein